MYHAKVWLVWVLWAMIAFPTVYGNPPAAIPVKTTRDQAWEGLYTANVHVRYHQGYAAYYGKLDMWSKIAAVVLGAVAFVVPLIIGMKKMWPRIALSTLGLAAFIVSSMLFVFHFDISHQSHVTAANRWRELAKDWESIRNQIGRVDDGELLTRVRELNEKRAAIETSEPPGSDTPYLAECEAAENHFLGVAALPKTDAKKTDPSAAKVNSSPDRRS
jgi:hypothetical protein